MYKLKKIEIINWLSIKHIDYTSIDGTKLIVGINKTDKGSKSNGSGKSSFEEAIYYSLTGNSLRKSTKNDLVRDNSDGAILNSQWVNEVTGEEIRIKREISISGVEKMSYITIDSLGSEKVGEFDKIINGNKQILDEIGIDKDQIQNYYLLSREKYVSFFRSPETDKRELVGRFSNANIIKKADPTIEQKISNKEQEISKMNLSLIAIDASLSVLEQEVLDDTVELFEERKKLQVDKIINEISNKLDEELLLNQKLPLLKESELTLITDRDIKKSLFDNYDLRTSKFNNHKIDLEKSISDLNQDKIRITMDIDTLERSVRLKNQNVNENKSTINVIETSIKGAVTCPNCEHQFLLNSEFTLEQLKEDLPLFQEETNTLLEEIDKIFSSIQEKRKLLEEKLLNIKPIQSQINRVEKLLFTISQNKSKADRYISDIDSSLHRNRNSQSDIQTSLRSIQERILNLDTEREEIEKSEFLPNEKRKELIKLKKEERLSIQESLNKLQDELLIYKESLISLNSFYIYVINNSLRYLQQNVNKFLLEFGSDLSVEIEGFKKKRDGSYSEKITPFVYRNGELVGSYEKLSSGEKAKLELSTILTNQAIINNSTIKGKGLDLLFIDEILDAVDGDGMMGLIKALENINRDCYITTHITHDVMDINQLTFVKENGITRLGV